MATASATSTSDALIAFHRAQRALGDGHGGAAARPLRRARARRRRARSTRFAEKPQGDGAWINGGFFVVEPEALDYIDGDDDRLGARAARAARRRRASSRPTAIAASGSRMDTLRDKMFLEELWDVGRRAWKVW